MSKAEFLNTLRQRLAGLPQADIDGRITFYEEMIDDRIEEGLTEEAAVAQIGTVDEVVGQIMSEIPLSKLVIEKVRPKRTLKVWEIVLLVLGSPVWLSLLIAGFAVGLSLYIVIWALALAFCCTNLACALGAAGCIVGTVLYLLRGNYAAAGFAVGTGLVCTGLSILMYFGSAGIIRGTLSLTKKIISGIKAGFIKKGEH